MPRLDMFPTLLRENFGPRTLGREPEREVMDEPDQVGAYAEAGRADGIMAASYLFHVGRASQAIQGCERVLDMGCGPATQLGDLARLNPEISFHGVDLSEPMLESGRRYAAELGLDNVDLTSADITRLEGIPDQSFDGVISTMTLHQLPTLADMRASLAAAARVLKPGGAVYIVDFARLKSSKSVAFFAEINRAHQSEAFNQDFLRSMRAAFLLEDLRKAASDLLPPHVRVRATFGIPLLTVIKSEDRSLPNRLRVELANMRQTLAAEYRRELDDMRLFFRLGGLRDDPFR